MIARSPFPDVDIPDVTVTEFVLRHADRLGSKAALIDAPSGRILTYRDLAESIGRVGAGLVELGLEQGEIVTILAPNSVEVAIAFNAVIAVGAVAAPLNPALRVEEIRSQLIQQRPAFVLTTPELLERATEAARGTKVRRFVSFGETDGAVSFEELLQSEPSILRPSIDPDTDAAAIFCSSGTSGLPKAVVLTHRNLVAAATLRIRCGLSAETDVVAGSLPFFHILGGSSILITILAAGGTGVILPRFDLGHFLQAIQQYRINKSAAAPPILLQLATNPLVDEYDLSSLEALYWGGAPLVPDIEEEVARRLGCAVLQGYGMTEMVPSHASMPPFTRRGSCGVCVPNTECKIVDLSSGAELAAAQTGEVCTRGPQTMKGYLGDDAATAAVIDRDGWVHTGDIGYLNSDGFLFIVDRLKELIKYKGYQVAPAELEAVLLTHPAVADVAVVRAPDALAGEVPKAFVVRCAPVNSDELIEFVADRVAPFKKVRRVEFIDEIPRSPAGKILRRELIARDQDAALQHA
jgi:acyl-CoA synthetase (AMP-forming)/AMP-acid ligase II